MQMARALTHTTTPPKDNGMSMWPRQNFVVAMPQPSLSHPQPSPSTFTHTPSAATSQINGQFMTEQLGCAQLA